MEAVDREMKTADVTDEMKDMYLLFDVESQVYGVEIRYVLQIIGMQKINTMPDMSPAMKGYINLRGSVIPVVSMRLHFGLAEEEYTERTCIIVVTVGDREIGLIVDAIQEAITIDSEKVFPPPGTSDAASAFYVRGVAQLANGRTAVLLNVPELFSDGRF